MRAVSVRRAGRSRDPRGAPGLHGARRAPRRLPVGRRGRRDAESFFGQGYGYEYRSSDLLMFVRMFSSLRPAAEYGRSQLPRLDACAKRDFVQAHAGEDDAQMDDASAT